MDCSSNMMGNIYTTHLLLQRALLRAVDVALQVLKVPKSTTLHTFIYLQSKTAVCVERAC